MKSIDSTVVLKTAFCESGERSSIEDAASDEVVNFATGFPAIFSKALKDGGKHIQRKDFNGILYQLSVLINQLVAGGCMFYDSNIQTRIGGYPKDAVVLLKNGIKTQMLVSNKDDNTESTATTNIGDSTKPWSLIRVYAHVDDKLDTQSSEPVENKVVAAAINTANNNAVHKTGAEDIAGVKTFSSSPLVPEAGESESSTKAASTSWVKKLLAKITATSLGALPTKGGTMTGTITFSTTAVIKKSANDGYLEIQGGSNADGGAVLQLGGTGYTGDAVPAGGFDLQTKATSGTSPALRGNPNGGLAWNGKNIVRSVNGVNAGADGNVEAYKVVSSYPSSPVANTLYFVYS